jgi:hypothetical protein
MNILQNSYKDTEGLLKKYMYPFQSHVITNKFMSFRNTGLHFSDGAGLAQAV